MSSTNLDHAGGQLHIADSHLHPAAQATAPGYGMEVLAPHTLSTPVDKVSVAVADTVPSGSRVTVDVRGRLPDRTWTEWTPALQWASTTVQVRITLQDNASGQSPTVRGVYVAASVRNTTALAGPYAPAPSTPTSRKEHRKPRPPTTTVTTAATTTRAVNGGRMTDVRRASKRFRIETCPAKMTCAGVR